MKAEKVLRLLLELDQQVISPRPSIFWEAADTVAELCSASEGILRDGTLDGWNQIDLSPFLRPAPVKLSQPIIDEIGETAK